jgi:hypothetical protein
LLKKQFQILDLQVFTKIFNNFCEMTSASSSDCGIASLANVKNQLSKNAAMPSGAGETWDQSIGREPNRTCALRGDDAVIEHTAFPNLGAIFSLRRRPPACLCSNLKLHDSWKRQPYRKWRVGHTGRSPSEVNLS